MMGDICNLLFQNNWRMVASGLCTESQYESGVIELVYFMACALKHLDGKKHFIVVYDNNKVKNEWEDE